MENDKEFQECTVQLVRKIDNGWSIDFDSGWSIYVPSEIESIDPVPGERVRLYGKGIGYKVRGIVIGGRVYRYQTADDAEVERVATVKRLVEEDEASEAAFIERLPTLPPLPVFELRDKNVWNQIVATNSTDPYSYECVRYAAAWANLMEAYIADGAAVDMVANDTSHKADTTGITGFMFGAAVNILSKCWKYGDQLMAYYERKT